MIVIFLDIDGVLNAFDKRINPTISHQHWTPAVLKAHGVTLHVETELMERVNIILSNTDAKIVITSSWRLENWDELKKYLEDYLWVGDIIDKTPYFEDKTRGDEILAWLDKHPEVTNYAVVDDSSEDNFPGVLDKFIRIDHHVGIQDTDVERIIEKLGL